MSAKYENEREILSALRAALDKLPPRPWTVWTSCSFRRIGGATGSDGDVLSAYNQRGDGHPDLTMPEGQLEALVEVVHAADAIIAQRESGGAESPVFDMSGWKSFLAAPAEAQARVEARASAMVSARSQAENAAFNLRQSGNATVEDAARAFDNIAETLTAALSGSTPKPALHPATRELVDRFATALAEKLAKAEAKYGYSDGWLDANWQADCREALLKHIDKGDPRDVAAYCAFMWHHGWSTSVPITTGDCDERGPYYLPPPWRPIADHDGSDEPVFAICSSAYTPTPFEAWFFDGAWRVYSQAEEKRSAGVTKWFPSHFITKADLLVLLAALTAALSGDA